MGTQIVLFVKCPHCGESLMDEHHIVNGHPGIKIRIHAQKGSGYLWLCPMYNCFMHDSDVEISANEAVEFHCPYCEKTLLRKVLCETCQAPMAGFHINIGGKVNVCSRKGCKNHYVVFEDPNDALSLFYDEFGTKY